MKPWIKQQQLIALTQLLTSILHQKRKLKKNKKIEKSRSKNTTPQPFYNAKERKMNSFGVHGVPKKIQKKPKKKTK